MVRYKNKIWQFFKGTEKLGSASQDFFQVDSRKSLPLKTLNYSRKLHISFDQLYTRYHKIELNLIYCRIPDNTL